MTAKKDDYVPGMYISQSQMELRLLEKLLKDKRKELAAYDLQLQARAVGTRDVDGSSLHIFPGMAALERTAEYPPVCLNLHPFFSLGPDTSSHPIGVHEHHFPDAAQPLPRHPQVAEALRWRNQ